MPDPIDNIFNTLKTGDYSKKYLDKFVMAVEPADPLLNVVPTLTDPDFFGTKTCNIIVFTKPFGGWDDSSVADSVSRLTTNFANFTRYESHFFIDAGAAAIVSAGSGDLASDISDLITTYNLASYGFHFWGELDSATLEQKIREILIAFYGAEDVP